MKTIAVQQFCTYYNISESFIYSLSNYKLIELVEIDSGKHIYFEDIGRIEKLIRIHFELNVNYEGLDIINNLLNEINTLQDEIINLRNRMNFYE